MSKPFSVDEADFETKVIKSNKLVVVDFWAVWCGPCKAIAPILEEVAAEKSDVLEVAKVNVDENNQLAAQYGIRSIPTLLLFKDGKQVDTMIGVVPRTQLMAFIDAHL